MHSIYIGQLLRPAAAPLIMRMCAHLGGVAIMFDYLHPAIQRAQSPVQSGKGQGSTQIDAVGLELCTL